MGLVLKLYRTSEQVRYLLDSVSQRLHSNGIRKFLATIIVRTLFTFSKIMDFIVVAFSTIELWYFSQEFHDIADSVWNLTKAKEQHQIFSGNFSVNLGQYSFTRRRISLAGR